MFPFDFQRDLWLFKIFQKFGDQICHHQEKTIVGKNQEFENMPTNFHAIVPRWSNSDMTCISSSDIYMLLIYWQIRNPTLKVSNSWIWNLFTKIHFCKVSTYGMINCQKENQRKSRFVFHPISLLHRHFMWKVVLVQLVQNNIL